MSHFVFITGTPPPRRGNYANEVLWIKGVSVAGKGSTEMLSYNSDNYFGSCVDRQ